MKRSVIVTFLLIITGLFAYPLYGQLSDTLVIGTAPSDFTTFSDAVSALNTQGVSGSLVFEIKPGNYTEQISINQITGANATKTATFQPQNGDSTSVVLKFASSPSSANNYVIQLNGADYITFDKITIKRTDTLKNCQVIEFVGSSRKNTFSNCIIEGNANTGNTQLISAVIGTTNTGFKSFNTFENNIIKNGSYGLYFIGQNSTTPDSNILVRNNKFINQSLKGMHIQSHRFAYIDDNEITNNTTNNTYNAIYLQYSNDTMRILKNKIALSTGYGINISNCNESVVANTLIVNNFISIGGTSNALGIYILNSKYLFILHNSINIYNSNTIQGSCIHINGSSTANLHIKNNILVNAGTGQGYTYYVSETTSSTPIAEANYNDLYIASGVYICWWQSAHNITTLTIWRTTTGFDLNSISTNPNFVSTTDLHATSNLVNGVGTPTLTPFVIKYDIDGDMRNVSTPDVGADEFQIENLGINRIELPPSGVYCVNAAFNVKAYIKNYGYYPFSGTVPVYYKIGASAAVNETTASVNIPVGDSVLYTFTNNETISTAGNYKLLTGTNLVADNNLTNDTTSLLIQVLALPVADFTYLPNDLEIIFTNTSTNATTYNWNFGDGNFSSDINPVHTYTAYNDYTVSLEVSNACTNDNTSQVITVAGVDELKEKYGISLWPNPANNYIHIYIKNNDTKIKSVKLYNSFGVMIYKNDPKAIFDELDIDITSLAEGIYFIGLEIDNKILYQKVLKNK